jgi:hypothetical protein
VIRTKLVEIPFNLVKCTKYYEGSSSIVGVSAQFQGQDTPILARNSVHPITRTTFECASLLVFNSFCICWKFEIIGCNLAQGPRREAFGYQPQENHAFHTRITLTQAVPTPPNLSVLVSENGKLDAYFSPTGSLPGFRNSF